jgi:hypothetical protein
MAVVINELEVAPAPAKAEAPAQAQAQGSSSTLTVTLLREIEKASRRKQRRTERLTAG